MLQDQDVMAKVAAALEAGQRSRLNDEALSALGPSREETLRILSAA
jgi:hypothetical protein